MTPPSDSTAAKAPAGALSFAMVAGETSGDLLAGLLIQGMHLRWPQAQGFGIGGPRMQALGFDAWWPHDKLAVRGYVEVLRHYRGIVAIRDQLRQRCWTSRLTCSSEWMRPISTLIWKPGSKPRVFPPCILCAHRSGLGGQSASKRSGAAWTTCCASFPLSPPFWPTPACRPRMWATLWRKPFPCTRTAWQHAKLWAWMHKDQWWRFCRAAGSPKLST